MTASWAEYSSSCDEDFDECYVIKSGVIPSHGFYTHETASGRLVPLSLVPDHGMTLEELVATLPPAPILPGPVPPPPLSALPPRPPCSSAEIMPLLVDSPELASPLELREWPREEDEFSETSTKEDERKEKKQEKQAKKDKRERSRCCFESMVSFFSRLFWESEEDLIELAPTEGVSA